MLNNVLIGLGVFAVIVMVVMGAMPPTTRAPQSSWRQITFDPNRRDVYATVFCDNCRQPQTTHGADTCGFCGRQLPRAVGPVNPKP